MLLECVIHNATLMVPRQQVANYHGELFVPVSYLHFNSVEESGGGYWEAGCLSG